MTIILEVHQLEKHFGDVQAVNGVSFQVEQGQIFGFLGPNGAGKTTTIGMILGLVHPTRGSVSVLGQPVTPSNSAHLKHVGSLVGATPAIIPYLTARAHLKLIANLHSVPASRISEVLEQVKLTNAADRKAGKFSTGMKQRLGLAMALMHDPDLLILDEPTNGMDPSGMREVRMLLQELAQNGTTIFLSSHLLNEVEQVCTHVAVLNEGQIVAHGPVEELLSKEKIIRVRVPDAQAALECLNGMSERAEANGTILTVTGVSSEDVVLQLTQHGIIPSEVTLVDHNLENLYMELTSERGK